jgi:hypothetical protein|tara:strand:- start:7482 stop:7748 length:267 start_codon:yes stop_codon:yes gene_type:complete
MNLEEELARDNNLESQVAGDMLKSATFKKKLIAGALGLITLVSTAMYTFMPMMLNQSSTRQQEERVRQLLIDYNTNQDGQIGPEEFGR